MMRRRALASACARGALAAAAVCSVACGSGKSEIPPELLDAIRRSEGQANVGTEVGDRVENLCFTGWENPRAAGFDPSEMTTLCLEDFREDPEARLLLLNSGAIWCAACRIEYEGASNRPSLAERLAPREALGFRVLGTLFQDEGGMPATAADASLWASTYDVAFPFAQDEDFAMGDFSVAAQAPFNMLVDLTDMTIVQQVQGDQPAVLFSTVDRLLGDGAPR